mmetsp:Transcript_81257/g.233526  ORF Transcript_81257/g.233526 Transcript_81257/m.233526 type:complete len:217 (-) Transcript_81257:262-912(-)
MTRHLGRSPSSAPRSLSAGAAEPSASAPCSRRQEKVVAKDLRRPPLPRSGVNRRDARVRRSARGRRGERRRGELQLQHRRRCVSLRSRKSEGCGRSGSRVAWPLSSSLLCPDCRRPCWHTELLKPQTKDPPKPAPRARTSRRPSAAGSAPTGSRRRPALRQRLRQRLSHPQRRAASLPRRPPGRGALQSPGPAAQRSASPMSAPLRWSSTPTKIDR